MELRVLNYFLIVAREENITRAAEQLHVTQPTLSRQLMQLERELGVKLFERSSHNIVLTQDGILLKRRAQEMIRLAEKTKRELSKEDENLSGEICIGSGEFKSVHMLAELIAAFSQKYPDVKYDLYSGNADNIKDQMEKGLTDIALLAAPVDISKYEFVRIQEKEKWGILVRNDSPLAEKEVIHPEDLRGQQMITSKRELVQKEFYSWLGEFRNQIDCKVTYNLLYNASAMVEQGLGVALCMELNTMYRNCTFVPLSPQLEQSSVLIWKKNQVMSPVLTEFIRFMKISLQKGNGKE